MTFIAILVFWEAGPSGTLPTKSPLVCRNFSSERACGGKTPAVTPSPFGDTDGVAQEITESATRREQKRLKAFCLKRDNFCCAITGLYDAEYRDKFPAITDDAFRDLYQCVSHHSSSDATKLFTSSTNSVGRC
ncbi:hypothetical protein DTO164E3_5584 [Paecilomyces variotii]|nr:hypothetical protein DTO164E3_5584 [Paecilomyces variotii]KAJ9198304.1 hypothetical protein DTO032I3_5543 [Paecilomyces variotii]KAJ9279294.1 hypothetical protein DTO021D3_3750 [Paecilomyces variotii]KAJ9344725.1 hypothetical protein DTO027B6_2907 [Paecilomyces variotii]KAJ9350637.1 hypothetical protein DTO027B9_6830 [Paecilomyces variotii]